jgi:hypothetical protein
MPRDVCNAPSRQMCCADLQGMWEMASLPEGPLKGFGARIPQRDLTPVELLVMFCT